MTRGEYTATANTKLLLHLNGNATDDSGNGNNGTATNVTYVDGYLNQGASFNWTSSDIVCPDIFTPWNTLSVSGWIKYSSWPGDAYFFNKDNVTTDREYVIQTSSNASHAFDVLVFTNNTTFSYGYCSNAYRPANNTWTHVWFTRDSSGTIKIYVNGVSVPVTQPNTSSGTINNSGASLYLGRRPYWPSPGYFAWQMDEFIVWDSLLSDQDMLDVYNATRWRALWEYVWWWTTNTKWLFRFQWNARDDSWNNNNGVSNSIIYSNSDWIVGQSAQFNWTSSNITFNNQLSWGAWTTLAAWVKFTSSSASYRTVVTVWTNTIYNQVYLTAPDTNNTSSVILWLYGINFNAAYGTLPAINDGKWHHVVWVVTGWSNYYLYYDGRRVGTVIWWATMNVTGTNWAIWSGIGWGSYWNGSIWKITVEQTAWSVATVRKIYTSEKWRYATV